MRYIAIDLEGGIKEGSKQFHFGMNNIISKMCKKN